MRRLVTTLAATAALAGLAATPAAACGGLVTPGGRVRLLRTATLAGYANGIEHYVTSFRFEGGGAEFGSIVPLPDVPTKVERGGDWTLQRLEREVAATGVSSRDAAQPLSAPAAAEVLYETRIDALDLTVLKGGGKAVGKWARDNGFRLSPDAPGVLDYYAERSPIFLAARFDAEAAKREGQEVGEGTPIHLTIPTENPWVPLRILGLGLGGEESVSASVFLLTERRPALLPVRAPGISLERRVPASTQLLDDLRSDKGMGWIPRSMWLTHVTIDGAARDLYFDLAVDASGRGRPSALAAGLRRPAPPTLARKPAPPATKPPAVSPSTAPLAAETDSPSPAVALPPSRPAGASDSPAGIAAVGILLVLGTAFGVGQQALSRRTAP